MKLLKAMLPPVVVLVVLVGALEVAVRVLEVKPYLLPAPSSVARVFTLQGLGGDALEQAAATRRQLMAALWGTAKGTLLGFGLSVTAGTLCAVVLAASVWVRRAFYPYAVLFQTVPIIAVAPLLVIWFDYGLPVVVATSFIASFFPVVANTLTGLMSTEVALREMFRLYGAGPVATVVKLRIPSALPSMLTGYRIAGGLAVIGAIVGEFVSSGGQDSLGAVIDTNRTLLRTDVVFAAVLLASGLGIVMFAAINAVGRLLLRHWHASEAG